MNLKAKSTAAVYWSAIEAIGKNGIQFLIAIVLARLLSPADFGVLAMLTFFTGIAMVFVDSGFGAAVIQKGQNVSPEETNAVFFFNVLAAAVMAIALCLGARSIAEFFALPILEFLTYFMAGNVVVTALGALHANLLARDLDFKTQARISMIATFLSGLVGIALAIMECGVWSLAGQMFASTVITTALLWYWRAWRPSERPRFSSLRGLFSFGSYLFLSGLLNAFYGRFTSLLIGKAFSPADLGYFVRADHTQQLPTSIISNVLNRVAFPIFAAAKNDKELLVRGVRKAIVALMTINVPMMMGLAAVAEPLVLVLFGEKWLPSVTLLRILCIAGIFWPLHVINLSVLKAQGHSNLFFWLDVVKKAIGISLTLLAATMSLEMVAWAQVLIGFVSFLLNALFTGRDLGYSSMR
ncbi:MAG: lipopolysaccharide biosynthesis protein, partial [Rhodocyclaceae bacterium]|nr:lipopolysaccharide biosynthesis protein [Rhodocyclaceae bacterium]